MKRARRHRLSDRNERALEEGGCGLVDLDLTPEAAQGATAVAHSLIEMPGRRAVAVFCGKADYDNVRNILPQLVADLLLECLPAFVRQLGGQIVYAVIPGDHRDKGARPAVQKMITIDRQPRRILAEGGLFIQLPDQRLVVSAQEVLGDEKLEIGIHSARDAAGFFRRWVEYAGGHNYLRGRAFLADGEILERNRAYTWDSIHVPDEIRQAVRTHVEGFLANRDVLRRLGVKLRRGLILSGPPGTGKTLLGKVLANTLHVSFIWVTPRHVTDAESFSEILSVARFVAPVVVFMEDLDLFAEDRASRRWMGLGELMNQLDGAEDNEDIIFIATTNHLETVEKALRNRPGRFDRVVQFGSLDPSARRRMITQLLEKAEVAEADVAYLVTATNDYTGAQIQELINTVYILAADKYTDTAAGAVPGRMPVDSLLIAEALDEFRVELKARVGFRVS
jgi:SpoVK/Ycf46/Vps4 family AAA+-type ATPase